MVAPLGLNERGVAPELDGVIEPVRPSTSCRKKIEWIGYSILLASFDAAAIYYSVTRWEKGDKKPMVTTTLANVGGLLFLFIRCLIDQYEVRNLRR